VERERERERERDSERERIYLNNDSVLSFKIEASGFNLSISA
jgi:hypothetical protein